MPTKKYQFQGRVEVLWSKTVEVDEFQQGDLADAGIDLDDPDLNFYDYEVGKHLNDVADLMPDDIDGGDWEVEVTDADPVEEKEVATGQ
jgi:hypothetical protein